MRGHVCHRRLVLHPGATIVVEPAHWVDTLVVVLRGELELTCQSGRRAIFVHEAVLTLDGMPARTLRNAGPGELILHLVRRER